MLRVNVVLNTLLGKKRCYFYYLYVTYMYLYIKETHLEASSLSFDVLRRLFWLKVK